MGKLFPPSLAEWHASVVGFVAGFAYGTAKFDADLLKSLVTMARGVEEDGHLGQTKQEAAYAGACFVAGSIAGSLTDNHTNND